MFTSLINDQKKSNKDIKRLKQINLLLWLFFGWVKKSRIVWSAQTTESCLTLSLFWIKGGQEVMDLFEKVDLLRISEKHFILYKNGIC